MCLGLANGVRTITLQEAWDVIKHNVDYTDARGVRNPLLTYSEGLVSMAVTRMTPAKPISYFAEDNNSENSEWKKGKEKYACPHCNDYVLEYMNNCNQCGQNLDWSSIKQQT
jgi:hypothetical protein